jgi:type IX secretion system PorP/SprF family membrane protein
MCSTLFKNKEIMRNFIFILLIGFFTTISGFAQQVPLYSQYLFSKYPYNPAVAGSDNRFVGTLGYRNQWMGFEGAPSTALLTFHGPLGSGNAIGAVIYGDKLGASERIGIMPGYSYTVSFDEDLKLSFGLQVGIIQHVLNGDEMTTKEQNDPSVPLGKSNFLYGDASFGVFLKSKSYYVGLSVPQLLNGSALLSSNFQNIGNGLVKRHLFAMGGVKIDVSDEFFIEPSLLLKSVQAAPLQLDVNCRFAFHKLWWVGLTYRTRASVALFAGIDVSDKVFMGYSFDYPTNEMRTVSDGSHEVFLGFKFNEKKRSGTFY